MDAATREIFSGIGSVEKAIFFTLAYASLAVFAGGFLVRMWYWTRGTAHSEPVGRSIAARAAEAIRHVFLEPRIRTAPSAGWVHLLIFWGFLVLFVGTEILTVEIDTSLSFFSGLFYLLFSLATDLFGVVLLTGVVIASYRRYVLRPTRLEGPAYGLPLALLGLLAVTGFVVEGLRLAHTQSVWYAWSPAGALVAAATESVAPAVLSGWHHDLWWGHAVIAFVFIAFIPFSPLRHAVVAPLNWFVRDCRVTGSLSTPFRLEDLESGVTDRVRPETVADLSWTQLMALDACAECGLCEEACPAWAADRPLSPKKTVIALRDQTNHWNGEPSAPLAELIGDSEAWSCTTCGACVTTCPVGIRQMDYLVDARRAHMMANHAPPTMAAALETLRTHGNLFGAGAEQRLVWTADLPAGTKVDIADETAEFDVIYWVGCAGAFDEQGQRTARAIAELLSRAGVRFAVLGPKEQCTGDPARRLGEEGLFQQLAKANIASLEQYANTKILTTCPHCFNTLKNEYGAFGGDYQVVHHTDYLAELISGGRLTVRPSRIDRESTVSYHDSCYLGRHNDIYDSPREILKAALGSDLREMSCSGSQSFCCGAGGGHAWFDLEQGDKINAIRYAEAQDTGADTIATACPYCRIMFDEAGSARDTEARLRVRDVAEILNEASRP
jgi:Fe-S oxidoreductase/nitrate reductase gamma subunit